MMFSMIWVLFIVAWFAALGCGDTGDRSGQNGGIDAGAMDSDVDSDSDSDADADAEEHSGDESESEDESAPDDTGESNENTEADDDLETDENANMSDNVESDDDADPDDDSKSDDDTEQDDREATGESAGSEGEDSTEESSDSDDDTEQDDGPNSDDDSSSQGDDSTEESSDSDDDSGSDTDTGSDDDSGSDTDTGPNTDTATGDCEPGESRCVDNTPQTCSDAGEWIDGAVCAEGCLNGNCVTNSTGGVIRLTDSVPGWASVAGGTTGGGTDIGAAIRVSTMGELQNAAGGSNPAIILVEPGNYNGSLEPGSNKTIIGTASGVTINGYLKISGDDAYNLIIRNIAVRGERCNTYDECKEGPDGVYIGNGAHHIWLDHIDIADGQDGNCDVTKEGDYVTISWTKFHYTYEKEHRYSNLIAGSDDETQSRGKLQITYMNCWWGERVDQRQPRGRFGKIHCLNNYHNTGGSAIHGVGKEMSLIAENSYYDEPGRSIWKDMGDPTGWKGIGNEGNASDMNDSMGSVFDIPYNYEPMPASQVPDAITASVGGAGNTCTLQE